MSAHTPSNQAAHPEHGHETSSSAQTLVKLEAFYQKHAVTLQWVMIAVAAFFAALIYWWRTTSAAEAIAWNDFFISGSVDSYSEVASTHEGTRAAQWAKLYEAEGYLNGALKDSFTNREKANTDLKKARELFEELLTANPGHEAREKILFGLARTQEFTSAGKLDEAISTYETLLKDFPETFYRKEVESRITHLKSAGAQSFYAWFGQQNPKPEDPAKPKDGPKPKPSTSPIDPLVPLTGLGSELETKGPGLPNLPLLSNEEKPGDKPADSKTPEPLTTPKSDDDKEPTEGEKPAAENKSPEAKPEVTPEKPAEAPKDEVKTEAEAPGTEKPAQEKDK